MKETHLVQKCFLTSMSCIYLFAFASLYHQLPGLFGDNGVLPVRSFAQLDERGKGGLMAAFKEKASLVWLSPNFGLDLNLMLDLVALMGVVLALLGLLTSVFRTWFTYFMLYVLYFSLYQVGQTFMSFQWDILLLEAGFLTIFVAPFRRPSSSSSKPRDEIGLWLIRWLLFRLMFASGVVKLSSQCNTWWGLTALNYHFESQCIPTPLSWFAHQLPHWLLRLGVVGTYVIEVGVPFLFFIPVPSLQMFSFCLQIFFQILIILTGNYNFFNFLTITLCIPLLNDNQLKKILWYRKSNDATERIETAKHGESEKGNAENRLQRFVALFVYFSLVYWTVTIFNVQLTPEATISSQITFKMSDFDRFLTMSVPFSVNVGLFSLVTTILYAVYSSIWQMKPFFGKVKALFFTVLYSCFAIWLFGISLVPHTQLEMSSQKALWPVVYNWYRHTQEYNIANSYGLFRRMTGVAGRPELVLEGSNSLESGWKEYHFMYKPGNLSASPQFIVPHQPRLDWQMWFAALGSYQNNPWLLSLVYRLLSGQKEVMELIDKKHIPFARPPKYMRAQLYMYKFSTFDDEPTIWWKRTYDHQYLQPVTKESLSQFLKGLNINVNKNVVLKVTNIRLKRALLWIRRTSQRLEPTTFIYSLLGPILAIKYFA